jgi:hypothetical protein
MASLSLRILYYIMMGFYTFPMALLDPNSAKHA